LTLDIPTDRSLTGASVDVILAGQAPSGGYIASPAYPTYHYAWLRDGSYCAMTMDAVGHADSADRFHDWVAGVIEREGERIDDIVTALRAGTPAARLPMLPARYTLDGHPETEPAEERESWPNFQLDGYGTWLFALERHAAVLEERHRAAVRTVAEYLAASWDSPCYDYWEEFGDRRHTSTFAAVAAGLASASRLLEDRGLAETAAEVRRAIVERCVHDGAFVKGTDDDRVDASLLSLSTPFELVAADDPRMLRTVERIRDELSSPSGGIRRYVGDTFYGGNPWIMLTAWWGWHAARAGDRTTALEARRWVERHAGASGHLAEQLTAEPQDPAMVQPWVDRWGPVADPLLWSHACYLMLARELETARPTEDPR
jgi:GH15 family glucan-1,4-alpha-glucosidase